MSCTHDAASDSDQAARFGYLCKQGRASTGVSLQCLSPPQVRRRCRVIGACIKVDSEWMSYGHLQDGTDASGPNWYNRASLLSNRPRRHGLVIMLQSATPDAFPPRFYLHVQREHVYNLKVLKFLNLNGTKKIKSISYILENINCWMFQIILLFIQRI